MPTSLQAHSLRHTLLCALLCGTLALPLAAGAAALGDATVRSTLGQPLEAEIEIASLSAAEADSLAVRLAPVELFAEAGVDVTALLRSLRFELRKQGDRQLIRVTSEQPVNDPFVTLLIEISANGSRVVRQYALLIDPPVIDTPGGMPNPLPPETAAVGSEPARASAPAAPPSAPRASSASPTEPLPSRITVRRGQTMASIAASVQPPDVRLEQVMVALQNQNPDAFVARNVHRIKRGSVLQVPEADSMRAVDPAAARRIVRAQTADFLRYQRTLAQRAAPAAAAATDSATTAAPAPAGSEDGAANTRSAGGRVGVQLNEPAAPAKTQDRLTLSAPTGTAGSDAKAGGTGGGAPDALDKVATEKALADANARIATLEKTIGEMQALLALQNKTLAETQQRATENAAADNKTAGNAAPESTAADNSAAPDNAPAEAPAPAATAPAPEAAAPAPAPASSAAPAATATPTAASGWAERLSDPILRAVIAAALLLLVLAWLAMRRRRRASDAQAAAPDTTVAQTVIGEAGGRHIDTSNSVFHSNFVPSLSQIDTNEVDALAEADVYIAYGRDQQAEEILRDALRMHPQRHALRLKLLEIFAARKDMQAFGTLAAELRVLTHGQGDEWAQAARLGQMLDPGNQLYGLAATEEPARKSPVADFELKLEGLLDERRRGPEPAEPAPSAAPVDFGLAGIAPTRPTAPMVRPEAVPRGDIDTGALNTKLELALACQEIGDKDGARELLNEVAAARDPALARRAQSLLRELV